MMLPNADLFVAMYVKRESVLSSQIEGMQASLTDVLQFEAGGDGGEPKRLRSTSSTSQLITLSPVWST